MVSSAIWVRVDGVPCAEIGAHSPPTWERLADGGCGVASMHLSTSPRAPHHALREFALLEVMCGAVPVYCGEVTEFDRQAGTLHATGLAARLYNYLALDSGGNTRDVGLAVAGAIERGWKGNNPLSVSGVVAGEADGNPLSVGALLDQHVAPLGQRWGVDEFGRLYTYTPPTVPEWIALPDATAFGETNEDAPTRLAGRFLDTTGLHATAFAGGDGIEESVDLTDRGELTFPEAEAILDGMLTQRHAVAWVNGVDLTATQIQTVGGSSAFFPMVRGGQLMRSFGASYFANGSLVLDTLIGKTVYTAGASTIHIEPDNTAPRDFVSVVAAA